MDDSKAKMQELYQNNLAKVKALKFENLVKGQYVDVLDEAKTWCIAIVVDVIDSEFVKITYDGWSEKYDEKVSIKRSSKITHFRKLSKGYTGQKKTALRSYYRHNNTEFEEVKGY